MYVIFPLTLKIIDIIMWQDKNSSKSLIIIFICKICIFVTYYLILLYNDVIYRFILISQGGPFLWHPLEVNGELLHKL